MIFNTYNKNDVALFQNDIIKQVFYNFDQFGLLYTYVIYNFNEQKQLITYIYHNPYDPYSENSFKEHTISVKEFIKNIEPRLINKKYFVIRGDIKEFDRYINSLEISNYIINHLSSEAKITENILYKLPIPTEFTKNYVDEYLIEIHKHNLEYSIKRNSIFNVSLKSFGYSTLLMFIGKCISDIPKIQYNELFKYIINLFND